MGEGAEGRLRVWVNLFPIYKKFSSVKPPTLSCSRTHNHIVSSSGKKTHITSSYFLFRRQNDTCFLLSYNLVSILLASPFLTVMNSFWISHHSHTLTDSSLAVLFTDSPILWVMRPHPRWAKLIGSSLHFSNGWNALWQKDPKSFLVLLSLFSKNILLGWLYISTTTSLLKTCILIQLLSPRLPSRLLISK